MIHRDFDLAIFLGGAIAGLFVLEAWTLVKAALFRKNAAKTLLAKPALALHATVGAGILCMAYGNLVEPHTIGITRQTLESPKLHGSLRIVQISDLHCESTPGVEQKLPPLINALAPDIIVYTGDSLNSKDGLGILHRVLGDLKAAIGKFAVKGNFDSRFFEGRELFGGTGFTWLENRTERVRKRNDVVYITGLDFGFENLAEGLLHKVPAVAFSILLYHTPDIIEDVAGSNVDLYFAGHTHGGQVRLPLLGALVTLSKYGKKYEMGAYDVRRTRLHVSRGVGLEPRPAPPVRFLAQPEVVFYEVNPTPRPWAARPGPRPEWLRP